MDCVALTLLGPLHLVVGLREVQPRHGKVVALLAYLALGANQRHSRESLAALLWPEADSRTALHNLRQTLLLLKRLVGDHRRAAPWLRIDRTTVVLATQGHAHWIDVCAFLESAPRAEGSGPDANECGHSLEAMRRLLDLYRGELLEGFPVDPELTEFAQWLEIQRRYLQRRALGLMEQLRHCHEKAGDGEAALALARRQVAMDPFDENGVRALMRLEAARGNRSAALACYELLRDRLAAELDVLPAVETKALYEALISESQPATPAALGQWQERPAIVLACRLVVPREGSPPQRAALLHALRRGVEATLGKAGGEGIMIVGDTMLGYFDATREHALAQALAAAHAIARTPPTEGARIGLHLGPVLPADDESLSDPLGATTAVTLRLALHAAAGEILLSAAAATAAAALYQCPAADEVLRCNDEPLRFHRLGLPRTDASAEPPFVGRAEALDWLHTHWDTARRGQGQAVLVTGEAGIGKTRLMQALLERLATEEFVLRRLECKEATAQSSFHPLILLLRQVFALDPNDPPEVQLACIEAYADHNSLDREATIPLLARLLSLPLGQRYAPPPLSPAQEREQLEALQLRLLRLLAARQPVLLWLEDLHWADPSTLRLVERILTELADVPVLLVATARPSLPPTALALPEDHRLALGPLASNEAEALAAQLLVDAGKAAAKVAARAEGVPLFIAELARTHRTGTDTPAATLEDLLSARLDALPVEDRAVLRAAAVLGYHFQLRPLAALLEQDHAAVRTALRRLANSGLVRHERDPDDHFAFHHALIHEAAYRYGAPSQRRRLHAHAAAVIAQGSPALAEEQPELVARHHEAAGEAAPAITWWLRAGRRSAARGAELEAIAQFQRGLALIDALAHSERTALELELLLALGTSQSMVEGFAAPATLNTWRRAHLLSRAGDDQRRLFHNLWGIFVAAVHQEQDYGGTEQIAHQLAAIADESGDPLLRAAARFALGHIHYWQGRFAEAEQELLGLDELARPVPWSAQQDLLFVFPVIGRSDRALACWALGRHDEALRAIAEANALAREVDDARSLVGHLLLAAGLHQRRREQDPARVYAQEAHAVATTHRFGYWALLAQAQIAWSRALTGDEKAVDELAELRQTMVAIMGSPLAYALALLTEAALAHGRYEQVLAAAEEGIRVTENGDGLHRSEFLRWRGEALVALGRVDEGIASLEKAIEVAERQHAPSLALRGALALARRAPTSRTGAALAAVERNLAAVQNASDLADVADARAMLSKPMARKT